MLWRGSKGSVSDDCLAIIGSDGKTYESDIIRDVDGPNITIQWSSPDALAVVVPGADAAGDYHDADPP